MVRLIGVRHNLEKNEVARKCMPISVTRLGYFWKALLQTFPRNKTVNICWLLGIFDKCPNLGKNGSVYFLGNFFEQLGYFKLHHLGTLLRTPIGKGALRWYSIFWWKIRQSVKFVWAEEWKQRFRGLYRGSCHTQFYFTS